ncbi:D-glycero-beta-D-manno-heptose-7-phosphate kinase [Mucilaginibacter agri]|uniref:D-glycero-beta-D-manno-heptose-7-phosphate kinase n=1 Tax=Mucilaginibacter agri TaxID=2695265 RepID=A0A965ZHH2_9SPHI|nr:D-glycero-beta-D-manno-heptose-7-phosphate kinase [Mucilaginibacter agri]NCD69827.1 D-glycero-beta-D-manno-heptose-7-phosphate kinase [Mucilaginibacter agri]
MLLDKVNTIRQKQQQPNILVIGDLMIDQYIWGEATRLSPEAPVPIVNVKRESVTLGGAANVAKNLLALGAKVTIGGLIGNDTHGEQLLSILQGDGIDTHAIITDNTRPTTVKTRVLAGNHQLVRIDREVTNPVNADLEEQISETLKDSIAQADIVLFSDYNKGLFTPSLTQSLITAAKADGKKVIVDPKGLDYSKYKGSFIIKPNRKELAEAAKSEKIHNLEDLQKAAKIIFDETAVDYLIVTLSEEGMVILSELAYQLLPVKATEVFDVTGAGDTVLATIAYFIAQGLEIEEASEVANHAAAIVIKHVGNATASVEEIIADMQK